jgi:magnesium transporter
MSRNELLRRLAGVALERYPRESAAHLELGQARDVARLFEQHEAERAAQVLGGLRPDFAADVIEALDQRAASAILARYEPSRAASLLARLEPEARAARLAALEPSLSKELTALISYPPGVAGAIMDPRVTGFRPDATASEVLARIRALRNQAIHTVFLIDPEGRLTGSVGIQDLALAGPDSRLDEMAQLSPPRVQALAPQDEVIAIAEDRRLSSTGGGHR